MHIRQAVSSIALACAFAAAAPCFAEPSPPGQTGQPFYRLSVENAGQNIFSADVLAISGERTPFRATAVIPYVAAARRIKGSEGSVEYTENTVTIGLSGAVTVEPGLDGEPAAAHVSMDMAELVQMRTSINAEELEEQSPEVKTRHVEQRAPFGDGWGISIEEPPWRVTLTTGVLE